MLLITGAYGNVGRRIVPVMIQQGFDVKVFDITPKVEEYMDMGAKAYAVGDGSIKEDMLKAVDGVDQILYIPPGGTFQETKIANNCVDAAVEKGVKQFVMLSVIHPLLNTLYQHTMKLNAERHLVYTGMKTGLNYTILQPTHYNHNIIVDDVLKTGEITCYSGDKKIHFVDAEDVALVAAKVLREGEKHRNATYELCGPQELTGQEVEDIFNRVAGTHVTTKYYTEKDMETIVGHGQMDSYNKELVYALQRTYNTWGFSGNGNVLEWLLGRPGTTLDEYFRKELKKLGKPVVG